LSKSQIHERFDEIVDFAELREFIDAPVKTYSSGMYMRLGFAVAINVDPDVLLVDEVLAVGDEAFQARCLERIRYFQKQGRTIVLVSHALDLVRQLCDQAVMLDHGVIHAMGAPDEVVREMRLKILKKDLEFGAEEGTKEIEVIGAQLLLDGQEVREPLHPGQTLTVFVDLQSNEPVEDPVVSLALHDGTNNYVFGADTTRSGASLGRVDGKRRVRFDVGPLPFTGGKYWVTVAVHSRDNQRIYHVQDQRYSFEVQQTEGRRDQTYIAVQAEVEDL
jgi:ABC-type glutathione transport system ATPase component